MPTPRLRTIGPTNGPTGTMQIPGVFKTRTRATSAHHCEDYVDGGYMDKPLDLSHRFFAPPLINGWNGKTGSLKREFINYPVDYPAEVAVPVPGFGPFSGSSDAALATEVAAKTNPSRAHVQLPVFWAEAREFPRLLKQTGDLLNRSFKAARSNRLKDFNPRDLANANLAMQFGWAPLIGDLGKLLNYQKSVEKRLDELIGLNQKGGLKRRRNEPQQTLTQGPYSKTLNSYGGTVHGDEYTLQTRDRWVTIRWKPNSLFPKPGDPKFVKKFYTYYLGLDPSQQIQNLWDAMPWTWLIDWFSTTGDFIQASNNSIAYISNINVMTHYQATTTWTPTSWMYYVSVEEGVFKRERKMRSQHYPSLVASLPILSNRQLSILGSLAVTKLRFR
nr:MAG: putative maturation protein [Leviviridae sp.]